MKIAYQGIEGSFAEMAAKDLAENERFAEYTLVPMEDSESVCKALDGDVVDYGVVALENSIGGEVTETRRAFMTRDIQHVAKVALSVSQCLFKASDRVENREIQYVASHEQALLQCKDNVREILGNVQLIPVEDTALAARRISEGVYGQDTAVLCSRRAGEIFHLALIQENVQDQSENTTWFTLFRLEK